MIMHTYAHICIWQNCSILLIVETKKLPLAEVSACQTFMAATTAISRSSWNGGGVSTRVAHTLYIDLWPLLVTLTFNPGQAMVTFRENSVQFGPMVSGCPNFHCNGKLFLLFFLPGTRGPCTQSLKKRAWRHGRAWKMKIRAWKNQDPCFNFYKHLCSFCINIYPV